ncbi:MULTISPECIES: DUF423 domain-containing protein [unclassified Salinivibrio]|uniref:DUF423 domain-containing protein n=1 Tax=unclassified Salinivibrio TaxID=2636825 RepID=UPI00128C0E70|nr:MULTISPECIES: DUF423 domain-containing protein [unclassified Salinivibrio]MPS32157.1 DUF423 domain-containing protein [Salinivibrio sp. VYel7]MPX93551.1 DUF423 domain-containing protein [Salinivibrio sp. VYel9]MPX96383.1 DUF423 domain-containing protein [Salinivibrio sp. VYel6]MPX99965.1 DUF423 domain-containing protein [Salinivibrio sp. VYel4]MPY02820.1 DUF423 domain-containing protein [Salinivibrio sp. VYel5]
MKLHHWVCVATIGAGLAVGLGAFAAHGLKAVLSDYQLAIFKTGVDYQMWHSLALLGICGVASQVSSRCFAIVAWAWLIGVVAFSGSLYLLALTSWYWLGPITPMGGVSFLIGWVGLAIGAWRSYQR